MTSARVAVLQPVAKVKHQLVSHNSSSKDQVLHRQLLQEPVAAELNLQDSASETVT